MISKESYGEYIVSNTIYDTVLNCYMLPVRMYDIVVEILHIQWHSKLSNHNKTITGISTSCIVLKQSLALLWLFAQ